MFICDQIASYHELNWRYRNVARDNVRAKGVSRLDAEYADLIIYCLLNH